MAVLLSFTGSVSFAEETCDYFREDQNIPTGKVATSLPFAYYPSVNKMEVAMQLTDELVRKAGTPTPREARVLVRDKAAGRKVVEGAVPLDAQGRGRALFDVPDLSDGEYRVEYVIGKHTVVSPKTFKRVHFPFEKTQYGDDHRVYPPFTPVRVSGAAVEVVVRRYTLNGFCLFDSVQSLGRELLASAVTLVGTTTDGKPIAWSKGSVAGKAAHEDEAVFQGVVASPQLRVESEASIGEDGCTNVTLRFLPGADKTPIRSLKLVVPLKDKEAPLFHYIADNAMRFNYAGKTPRGGTIQWYREPWDHWVPYRWKVETPGSDDGVLITAADPRQHHNEKTGDHRPVLPYIWLGAERRGLAVFLESDEGFITGHEYPGKRRREPAHYVAPLNRVVRRGDTVAIELDIFRGPCTLDAPREITLGFMASPGKPMEKEFRTRQFASGVGGVVCWGGWLCGSKYPTNHDWSIVDKIQEIRSKASREPGWVEMWPEDAEWFKQKSQEVARLWPGREVYGTSDWLTTHLHFVKSARAPWPQRRQRSGTYFEEHAHDVLTPEWEVFQDEWASVEFNRFQHKPGNWGVFAPSYHDFALCMANEWLKRGVSLYFDNCNPKRCYNTRFGPAYYAEDGTLRYGTCIFSQRRYYRRIYKLVRKWNDAGVPYPVDFTVHMTSTAALPLNTWATATLDFEQRFRTAGPGVPAEPGVPDPKGEGYQLPWPADYLRAVTFGRQCGTIPLTLDFASGHSRHPSGSFSPELLLRNWTMSRIHDIRVPYLWVKPAHLARKAEAALQDFGYGTNAVVEHNYWAESPFVGVDDERVKWMALVKKQKDAKAFGLLLLQSYSRTDAVKTRVRFPEAGVLVDVLSGKRIPVKENVADVDMPSNYGSRLFTVAR